MINLKIDGAERVVNGAVCGALTPVVRDAATRYTSAPTVPPDEAHARALARQAGCWAAFVTERSRMTERTITAKTLDSLAYSVLRGARAFAVPSKLTGTKAHQRTLWALVRDGYRPFEALSVDTHSTDGIAVTLGDEPLGSIQPKHVPWARPLVPFGLSVHIARVTGSETGGYTLGCNVVLGGVGAALDRLLDALGTPAGGDGAASTAPAVPAGPTEAHGDGAATAVRLVVPPASEVSVEAPVEAPADPADVVLWRTITGEARATVPHAVRHSPTGIEWAYSGAGPADLARSVLLALTDEATAERLYGRFVADVVACVPFAGGVLRASDVRAWVARQDAPRPAA